MEQTATAVEKPASGAPPTEQTPASPARNVRLDGMINDFNHLTGRRAEAPGVVNDVPTDEEEAAEEDPGDEQPEEGQEAQGGQAATTELSDEEKLAKSLREELLGEKDESAPKTTKPVAEWLAKNNLDLNKVLSIGKLESDLASATRENATLKTQLDAHKALPVELKNAMVKAMAGQDWRGDLDNHPSINADKSFKDHDLKKLVPQLSGTKLEKEDWAAYSDEEDGDPIRRDRVRMAIELAEAKFNTIAGERNQFLKEKAASDRAFNDGYMSSQKAAMDNIGKNIKSLVAFAPGLQDNLTPRGIHSAFHDEKGFLKPDAAENRIWADPDKRNVILNAILNKANKAAKEEADLNAIGRTDERPKAGTKAVRRQAGTKASTEDKFLEGMGIR